MEVEVVKQIRVQRSKEEIISMLEQCRDSRMSVKEFVKLKGIHEATYYNWRNKYGSKVIKQNSRSGFSELKIKPSPLMHAAALFAEFRGLKIYQPVSAAYLKELI